MFHLLRLRVKAVLQRWQQLLDLKKGLESHHLVDLEDRSRVPDLLGLLDHLRHDLLQLEQGVRSVNGPCNRSPVAASNRERWRKQAGFFDDQELLGLVADLQLPQRTEPVANFVLQRFPERQQYRSVLGSEQLRQPRADQAQPSLRVQSLRDHLLLRDTHLQRPPPASDSDVSSGASRSAGVASNSGDPVVGSGSCSAR